MAKKHDIFNSTSATETLTRLRRILVEERLMSEQTFPKYFGIFLGFKYGNRVKVVVAKNKLIILYKTDFEVGCVTMSKTFSLDEQITQANLKINRRIDVTADEFLKKLNKKRDGRSNQ